MNFYLVLNNFGRRSGIYLASLIISIATGMSLLGLGQYFLGLNHSWWIPERFLASTYVNHNHFAGYLEIAIPLCIAMILGLKREKFSNPSKQFSSKFGLVAALIIMFTALIFSQSRGGWISLVVALFVMNIVLIRK